MKLEILWMQINAEDLIQQFYMGMKTRENVFIRLTNMSTGVSPKPVKLKSYSP